MLGLVDGQVIINNQNIALVPNSVERRYGRGETTVATQSLGAGNVDTVHSVDNTTAKSYFKFSMKVTQENIDAVDAWKLNLGANVIRYIGTDSNEIYEQMSVINDPTYPDSNDAVIEVEFEGNPLIK